MHVQSRPRHSCNNATYFNGSPNSLQHRCLGSYVLGLRILFGHHCKDCGLGEFNLVPVLKSRALQTKVCRPDLLFGDNPSLCKPHFWFYVVYSLVLSYVALSFTSKFTTDGQVKQWAISDCLGFDNIGASRKCYTSIFPVNTMRHVGSVLLDVSFYFGICFLLKSKLTSE